MSSDYEPPVVYSDNQYSYRRVRDDITGFLRSDFDVSRLDTVHQFLWLAGLPQPTRPLHRQVMMGRRIILTEQADLHLTWTDDRIMVKPFPSSLLDKDFWTRYIPSQGPLARSINGFVFSYMTLVSREIDFQMAITADGQHGMTLLPPHLQWKDWVLFVSDFLKDRQLKDVLSNCSPRYAYGELRLGRLNLIYRLAPQFALQNFLGGYHFGFNTYESFIRRNFAWLIVVFAYISIVLAAMQVGLAIPKLIDSSAFMAACYGFVVLSILAPVMGVVVMAILFVMYFFTNLSVALVPSKLQKKREIAKV